jgi:8-oxo-dGTP pyrophosphatase MutT (NUDIX family)
VADILIPRPAATVLALRDRPRGFEVLMLQRSHKSDFVGGSYVFPGGGVDDGDAGVAALSLAFGITDEEASRRLGLESGGLAYYVACLRELFEEAGLLIACTPSGEPVRLDDPDVVRRIAAHRRAVNAKTMGFVEMMERERLFLDLRGLAYLAHWVTPVGLSRRYDTRFFVALAPGDQIATHDEGETIADQWLRPSEALAAHERGNFEMAPPTISNLQAVENFTLSRQVLEYADSLDSVARIEPRIVTRDGRVAVVLPGEPGYDD